MRAHARRADPPRREAFCTKIVLCGIAPKMVQRKNAENENAALARRITNQTVGRKPQKTKQIKTAVCDLGARKSPLWLAICGQSLITFGTCSLASGLPICLVLCRPGRWNVLDRPGRRRLPEVRKAWPVNGLPAGVGAFCDVPNGVNVVERLEFFRRSGPCI